MTLADRLPDPPKNYAAIAAGQQRMAAFRRRERRMNDHDRGRHRRDLFADCPYCAVYVGAMLRDLSSRYFPSPPVPTGFLR